MPTPVIYRREELKEIEEKARLYLSVGRFDAAEKILRSTLSDYGPLSNIHNLLGVTFHRQSKFREALQHFRKAWEVNGAFVEAALNLAATLCDLSQYEEARAVFSQIMGEMENVRKRPRLVLGRLANQHVATGRSYQENGMIAEAIQEYLKALSLYDHLPDVRLTLGKLYCQGDQLDRARQELETLVKEAPDMAEAYTWLGVVYFRLSNLTAAKDTWAKAQAMGDRGAPARAYLKIMQSIDLEAGS